ncbi:MAG: TonB family protein [Methylococcales bacterium]|nr:TonB family protein [Methylococcales bacterium]
MNAAPCRSNGRPLLAALLIATLAHIAMLLGFNPTLPPPAAPQRPMVLTLASMPIATAQNPDAIQTEAEATAPKTGKTAQSAADRPIRQSLKAVAGSETPARNNAGETQKPPVSKTPAAESPASAQAGEPAADKPLLTAETLQQQISQLGEQIRNRSQTPQAAKIKLVNSVTGHKFLAAQYVKDWGDKVERTGNLNYPEAARNKGEAQTLTMDVGINADGSIYSMRIVRSSGNAELDEAAKHIVRMSAPFASLPLDLLQEVNVLVITRVWKFSDQTGMTAR